MNHTLFIKNVNGMIYTFPMIRDEGLKALEEIRAGIRSNWMHVEYASLHSDSGKVIATVHRKDCE